MILKGEGFSVLYFAVIDTCPHESPVIVVLLQKKAKHFVKTPFTPGLSPDKLRIILSFWPYSISCPFLHQSFSRTLSTGFYVSETFFSES